MKMKNQPAVSKELQGAIMIRQFIFLMTAVGSAPSRADCPVADMLIDQYGISFSGFKNSIPRVVAPSENETPPDSLLTVRLPNKRGEVPDGFAHAALINKDKKRAWIMRNGGFLHVHEWYGPVALKTVDLSGCVTEPGIIQLGRVKPGSGS